MNWFAVTFWSLLALCVAAGLFFGWAMFLIGSGLVIIGMGGYAMFQIEDFGDSK